MLDWPEPLLPVVPLVPELQTHDAAAEVLGVARRQLYLGDVAQQWVNVIYRSVVFKPFSGAELDFHNALHVVTNSVSHQSTEIHTCFEMFLIWITFQFLVLISPHSRKRKLWPRLETERAPALSVRCCPGTAAILELPSRGCALPSWLHSWAENIF